MKTPNNQMETRNRDMFITQEIEATINRVIAENIKAFTRGLCEENKKIISFISLSIARALFSKKDKYKFVINPVLFEKGNSDILMSGMCLWNNQKDRHVKVEFEHKDFICMVTVWIISYD